MSGVVLRTKEGVMHLCSSLADANITQNHQETLPSSLCSQPVNLIISTLPQALTFQPPKTGGPHGLVPVVRPSGLSLFGPTQLPLLHIVHSPFNPFYNSSRFGIETVSPSRHRDQNKSSDSYTSTTLPTTRRAVFAVCFHEFQTSA